MRILLAEDEHELSKALTVILKHENYSVDTVFDGEDALDYIESGIYDAIILDIMMPKIDGLSVLKKIRASGIPTPVLLLTAKSEIEDKVAGLDSGADDYVTKPFSAKELLARLRSILRRRNDNFLAQNLAVGNTVLDMKRFVISCNGNEIRLANKEFQMLEMLMSNHGTIISQDRFMDKIWGYDSETDQNVVWVYISYLRKKLMNAGSDLKIHAHRNLGYSIEINDEK